MASNCEECVHYDYDDEMDVCTAPWIWMKTKWSAFCALPTTRVPFTGGGMITLPPAVSEEEPWNW